MIRAGWLHNNCLEGNPSAARSSFEVPAESARHSHSAVSRNAMPPAGDYNAKSTWFRFAFQRGIPCCVPWTHRSRFLVEPAVVVRRFNPWAPEVRLHFVAQSSSTGWFGFWTLAWWRKAAEGAFQSLVGIKLSLFVNQITFRLITLVGVPLMARYSTGSRVIERLISSNDATFDGRWMFEVNDLFIEL